MTRLYLLVLTAFFFLSCNTQKSVIQTKRNGTTSGYRNSKSSSKKPETIAKTSNTKITNDMIYDYIKKYEGVAQSNMKTYGIPASIILAQALLESGYGSSPLCVQANNHFGIKCNKDWNGPSVNYDDDTVGECFRKYNNPSDSFRDHAVFLTSGSRYASLFKLDSDDYKGWANGLKAAGYATDPQYPTKLITLIEKYQLDKYDDARYKREELSSTNSANPIQYVVEKGDTLYSISKKFNVSVDELKRQNNIFDNAIAIGQTILILK